MTNLPTKPGVYHIAEKGETVADIARLYGVAPEDVARANKLLPTEQLGEGRVLFVPGAERQKVRKPRPPALPPPKVPPAVAPTKPVDRPPDKPDAPQDHKTAVTPPERKTAPRAVSGEGKAAETAKAPPAVRGEKPQPIKHTQESSAAAIPKEAADRTLASPTKGAGIPSKGLFSWPVKGRVVSRFGVQPGGMVHNHIRINAKEGSVVTAAAAGAVIFSAPLKDFGETIIIKHEKGFATVYTH
ncbi:MAG: peptidoglycan DD-metalloendopeptidase family protein, partial [Syntrophales bacterium]|nr:peptidoglycan DD-metalloendopeptidase family protein [Syntrophales bacterium]